MAQASYKELHSFSTHRAGLGASVQALAKWQFYFTKVSNGQANTPASRDDTIQ